MILGPLLGKVLLLLHAAAAIALMGAAVHFGILSVLYLRGRFYRLKLQQTYLKILMFLYPATFLLGLVIYPRFRVHVRGEYFDKDLPLATCLFEIKEHGLALGFAVLLVLIALHRSIQIERPSAESRCYNFLGVFLAGVVVFSGLAGLALVSLRSI